jgi:hypothetical protein
VSRRRDTAKLAGGDDNVDHVSEYATDSFLGSGAFARSIGPDGSSTPRAKGRLREYRRLPIYSL